MTTTPADAVREAHTELERIIAEMREPENSGQFGPWQFTADNIKDWADRLAALAGAAPVASEHADALEGLLNRKGDCYDHTLAEHNALIAAIRLLRAPPASQPVAWLHKDGHTMMLNSEAHRFTNPANWSPLYDGPHAPAKAREDDARRVLEWIASEDTGMSSEAIAYHMLGMYSEGSHPHDPSDLGRCLRLLELFPAWKPRIREMATYSRNWAALSARWEELAVIMDDEVGIDWSKGHNAPRTYEAMQAAMKRRPKNALATFAEGAELRHVDHPDCNHCYSLMADKQGGE